MISVTFRMREGSLTGFTVSGHAGAGSAGRDIVCAAVSSAVYMAANTVTDVLHCPADITVGDGLLSLDIPGDAAGAAAGATAISPRRRGRCRVSPSPARRARS